MSATAKKTEQLPARFHNCITASHFNRFQVFVQMILFYLEGESVCKLSQYLQPAVVRWYEPGTQYLEFHSLEPYYCCDRNNCFCTISTCSNVPVVHLVPGIRSKVLSRVVGLTRSTTTDSIPPSFLCTLCESLHKEGPAKEYRYFLFLSCLLKSLLYGSWTHLIESRGGNMQAIVLISLCSDLKAWWEDSSSCTSLKTGSPSWSAGTSQGRADTEASSQGRAGRGAHCRDDHYTLQESTARYRQRMEDTNVTQMVQLQTVL